MRVAVYSDYAYRRNEDGIYTDQAFALFVSGLADHVSKLVMVGRLDPKSRTLALPAARRRRDRGTPALRPAV